MTIFKGALRGSRIKHSRWFSKWFILPAVAVTMIAALVVGMSAALFTDTETSNDSTFAAWTSTQWTQTSQADFNAGVLSGTNTSLSPDNVILSAGAGSGANMILFWDGAGTAPSGWTFLSDSGGAFYQRFPRGAATYGPTGGAATHTHTVSLVSDSGPSATTAVRSTGTNRSSATHTHGLSSGSTVPASNLPSYRNLRVITSTGVPTTIPMGAIAIFDTTAPTGWTRYSAQDNYFVQGEATAGTTGGSNTHTHSTSISLAASASYQAVTVTTAATVADTGHTHSGSGTTASGNNQPPYITVILAKANDDTAIPGGMIAMFDASPSGDWTVLSGSGGGFDGRFIVGSSTYGTTGGASTHTHSNLLITTGGPTANANTRTTGSNANAASNAHTHGITVSFNSPNHLPPYVDVIFAKALYASSGTIASQVLNTTVDGSRWDALFWDESLATGTDITFAVRASDAVFLKDAVTPSWTSVGGTSPVLTGLTSGSYKQWRATLTSNGSQTNTPTLQEVRVFYYGG